MVTNVVDSIASLKNTQVTAEGKTMTIKNNK